MTGRSATPAEAERAPGSAAAAFTLIELLVVVAIITMLVSILLPSLGAARAKGRATKCLAQLHVLGQGLVIYSNEYADMLVPSRLPKWPGQNCDPWAELFGRKKYRPTFTAMMSLGVGVPPFEDPKACRTEVDKFGEPGDQQNFSYPVYVCPSVPEWTDERNGSYGYNYQFLGNSRLRDSNDYSSYKNWPVPLSRIHDPARTVAVADCMGSAASFAPGQRREYVNNGRDANLLGNEGFNLDPPRVDPVNGEMADAPEHRSAADPRHGGRANVLFVDGHVTAESLQRLGYQIEPDGRIANDGPQASNAMWTGSNCDAPWTVTWTP